MKQLRNFLEDNAMKPPLSPDSPKYLRRLVRALNAEAMTGNGFYAPAAAHSVRCGRARLKDGKIEVHSTATHPEWFAPSANTFSDPYGREIVASRQA